METHDQGNTSLRVASFACYLDTAKDNMVRRVSGQEANTSPLGIKFSKNQDHANLRVDSFSYLNTTDHNFVFEVPDPIQDPTSAFTFSHEIPKDGEIGVFNADKYFNMKLEYKTESNPSKNIKNQEIKPKTPSLCSASTSWNSQSTLLPNHLHRSESLAKKKANGCRIFTGFGCTGPCFDKKSVHINEIVAQGAYLTSKASQVGSERTVHQDDSRPSIEVFGSSNSSKGGIATNMERKLSMLTWDAIPKGRNLPTSKNGSTSISICDEIASDASSDLFEIENISGSVFPLEQLGDEMSNCMSPASIYAPSENSIQWSVVTASVADYSVIMDCNDEASVSVAGEVRMMNGRGSKTRVGGGRETKKGGLLGCKNLKAVDVAENVCVKSNDKVKKIII
ncbi:hypothetical protein ACS0TY_006827 [Phlomoides rotata]